MQANTSTNKEKDKAEKDMDISIDNRSEEVQPISGFGPIQTRMAKQNSYSRCQPSWEMGQGFDDDDHDDSNVPIQWCIMIKSA